MPRRPRILTRPNALVEIVNRTFQGKLLIRPGKKMNALTIGALAKAQKTHNVQIHGGACLGNHFHLLISAPSVKAQADFMRDFTRKMSIEISRIHNWEGTVFPDRYRATEISDEEEAQISRLAYCLRNGCKENLVASPLDWPGVNFARAMLSNEPLQGIWIDRTAYRIALRQNQTVDLSDFTEHLELTLSPLPCLKPLSRRERADVLLNLIRDIEKETEIRHRIDGTTPLGAEAILTADPHSSPKSFSPGPKSQLHAFSLKVRKRMQEALLYILAAYREAADQLRKGEAARFPENTFPSTLPFVPPRHPTASLAIPELVPI